MRPFKRRLAAILLFFALFHACPAAAGETGRVDRIEEEVRELKRENQELKKRLDEIETDDEETRHRLGVISNLVDVSGYADAEFTLTDKKGENNRFSLRHLSLFFTKDIQREWKLFTEVEFEDAPRIESNLLSDTVGRSQGTVFLEQIYIEYHPDFNWDIRGGRFLTPAGIWPIYHYPPYVPTQTAPLFYKVIFPEVTDGVQLRNSFTLGNSNLDTSIYVANGSGNPGATDRNNNKAAGARANLEILPGLSGGLSYYREKDNQDVVRASYGAHLLYGYSNFKLQAEYAIRDNKQKGTDRFNDAGSYAQLSYDIGKWTAAGRIDWYDKSSKSSSDSQYRYTAAIDYHFAHNVVGKVEFDRNEFNDDRLEDFNEVVFAIAVAIGDL